MTKERIQLTCEMVSENKIKIQNEHTEFCRIERVIFPDVKELEKEVKALRKQLKSLNVSLVKTDTLKILKEQKQEYNEMVNDYNNSFDQLVKEWTKKLEEGLYTGYRDDNHLNDIIRPLQWKLEKMNHRNTLFSKILDIMSKVERVKTELKYKNEYTTFVKLAI